MTPDLAHVPSLSDVTTLTEAAVPPGDELLDLLPQAVVVCDLRGRVVRSNARYQALFGAPDPTREQHLRELVDEASRSRLPSLIAAAYESARAGDDGEAELTVTCRTANRAPLPCSMVLRVLNPTLAGRACLIVLIRPLNEASRRLERLRRSELRLSTLLAHLPLGVLGADSGIRTDFVNAAGADVFAAGPEELIGMGWLRFVHPDDARAAVEALEAALAERRPAFVPVRIVPNGTDEQRWVHLRVAPVGSGDDVGFVATIEDVTAERRLGEELAFEASHDRLTGVLNRTGVEGRLRGVIDDARALAHRPAMLFVDVDDFKDVNDGLGHLAGDRLLFVIAQRLQEHVADGGWVARFGGDEFLLVHPHLPSAQHAVRYATTVLHALNAPVRLDGNETFSTVSIGLVWLAADDLVTVGPTEMLRKADLALCQAKRRGKSQVALADDSLLAGERQRLRLARGLRRAIHEDLLDVHYQPIVDLADERIVGFEALVRWTDPELGRVSPDLFVPAAEANGLVGALGRNVLRRALADVAVWRQLPGYERLYVSVNMSMHELDEQSMARQLAGALGEAELPASALYVELTESALLRRESTTIERLEGIRRLGIRLAIDDFGTGYSSLARLRRLPVDLVKIDREFVCDLGLEDRASSVVGAIANLAEAMGLFTVAEGIETELQLEELRRRAGGYGQGFLFSPAVPADQVPELLTRQPLRRRVDPAQA